MTEFTGQNAEVPQLGIQDSEVGFSTVDKSPLQRDMLLNSGAET